uniref:hypothetical protein n=1 Tax=Okeania sp. SIO2F4 TaxID=2607790 RepID=UPI0025D587E0|nr:hypothetical protein [Okeania sp. SIO2F4]
MTYVWLTLASILGWFVSTLAGGGSSFLLMPIVGLFLGTYSYSTNYYNWSNSW